MGLFTTVVGLIVEVFLGLFPLMIGGVFSGTFGVMLCRAFSELVRRLLRRLLRGLIVGVIVGLFMGEIVGLRLGGLLIGVLDLFLHPMVENGAMHRSSLNSLISSATAEICFALE